MTSAATDPTTHASAPHRARFLSLLAYSVAQDELVKLVLSKYHGPEPDLLRVLVKPVALRGQACLSFVYRHQTKDITRNLPVDEGLALIASLLVSDFRNAHLMTLTNEAQLAISKKGQCTVKVTVAEPGAAAPSREHNREKHRFLTLDRPFLVELGVTTAQHQLVPAMSRKWKQINKFVEVFSHALAASPLAGGEAAVRVVDFGAGKGYLTFAIHDYLSHGLGRQAQVTGVELRKDLVDLCNGVVSRLCLAGLRFDHGDVRDYAPEPIDVMIALHACDVATDHAIHLGLRAGASIILCSPCCHKQVRPQLLSPHPLRPILQHGVHLGQQAEMLTDGLRALWLEACGYETQVFEFVSLEHTNKNKMILAVKRPQPAAPAEVLTQIDEIKRFYGIREHCLETLLRADGLLG